MANRSLTLAAPAKLNITLRILGKRKDGMHDINSVMTPLEFADEVTVSERDDRLIRRRWTHPQVRDDLCVRAARLFQQKTRATKGADIKVQKHIPVGGGLGGGSANAAAVIWALNRLWNVRWGRRKLMEFGALLGADVPFFLFGRAARARGVGDELTPARNAFLRRHSHYLLTFPKAVSHTSAAYEEYEKLIKMKSKCTISGKLVDNSNDLAEAVFKLHPRVAEAAGLLRQTTGEARLSGSGGCVYAAFVNRKDAENARIALPKKLASVVTSAFVGKHVFGE